MHDSFEDGAVDVCLDLPTPGPQPGALGWVDAAHTLATHAALPEHDTLTREELYTISSAALRTYVWTRALNPHDDTPGAAGLAALFTNFGITESLSYYTGWAVQSFNGLSRQQLWQLVRFELEDGRALGSLGMGGALAPLLIVGASGRFGTREVFVRRAGAPAGSVEAVALHALGDAQGGSEDFVNWLLTVRPSDDPRARTSRARQRVDVLRWAAQHARTSREFFHETRANYAPGLKGWEATAAQLAQPDGLDAEALDALHVHLGELAVGRGAAAATLPAWAEALEPVDGVVVHDLRAARQALRDAADAYAGVAAELSALTADTPLTTIQQAHQRAHEHERHAVRALERAAEQLPRVF